MSDSRKKLTCYKVQQLMDLYIANDPMLTIEESNAFEEHLRKCAKCMQEYEECKLVIDLLRKYWSSETNNTVLLDRLNDPAQCGEIIAEGWEGIKLRIPELCQLEKRQKYLSFSSRAIAVCLIIVLFIFYIFSIYLKPEETYNLASRQTTAIPKAYVKVEAISKKGNILIPLNKKIKTAANELTTLLINNKHRMILNRNTVITIEPLVENSRLGCLVKLDSDQIYTYVEHDGAPFVVNTIHGKAVITGTIFDIKATEISTTLVVVEGRIQFESEKGVVCVSDG